MTHVWTAGEPASEAPVVVTDRRDRNERMDTLLRKVAISPRFTLPVIAAAVEHIKEPCGTGYQVPR